MFGYVNIHKEELKIKEYETYKGFYCGACQSLKQAYGFAGQMTLSYDMTFLTVLLSSLYEPRQEFSRKRCIAHPRKKRLIIQNEFSDYTAHMSILLTWYKLLDDWQDERKKSAWLAMKACHPAFVKARSLYGEKDRKIRQYLQRLARLEKDKCQDIDRVAGTFGRLLGEIYRVREDAWQEYLYWTGFYLGKFIYLMDAWDDLEKDELQGNYNILLLRRQSLYGDSSEEQERFAGDCEALLLSMMAACTSWFERLPLVQDVAILRNILYDGVWSQFDRKKKESRKASDKEEDGK